MPEAELLSQSREEQERHGYFHTLREILQQPSTWLDTAERMLGAASELSRRMEGIRLLVLTGSGSSEYAGACVQAFFRTLWVWSLKQWEAARC